MPGKSGSSGASRSKSKSFTRPKNLPPEQRKIRIPVVGGGGLVRPKRKRNPAGVKIPGCSIILAALVMVALVLAIVF